MKQSSEWLYNIKANLKDKALNNIAEFMNSYLYGELTFLDKVENEIVKCSEYINEELTADSMEIYREVIEEVISRLESGIMIETNRYYERLNMGEKLSLDRYKSISGKLNNLIEEADIYSNKDKEYIYEMFINTAVKKADIPVFQLKHKSEFEEDECGFGYRLYGYNRKLLKEFLIQSLDRGRHYVINTDESRELNQYNLPVTYFEVLRVTEIPVELQNIIYLFIWFFTSGLIHSNISIKNLTAEQLVKYEKKQVRRTIELYDSSLRYEGITYGDIVLNINKLYKNQSMESMVKSYCNCHNKKYEDINIELVESMLKSICAI